MYLVEHFDTNTIQRFLDPIEAKLILGMVMGLHTKKSLFDSQIQSVGLTHLLVLSGSNITFLVKFFQFGLPIKGIRKRTWASIAFVSCIPFIFGYEPSTIRAVIMAILPMLCILAQKIHSASHVIVITALIMLIFDPSLIFNISFQLSFGAILGIYLFADKEGNEEGFKGYVESNIRTSLSAQVFTTPLILLHFNTFSTVALIANILVTWTVPLIMMLGTLYICSELINVSLVSQIFSFPLHILLSYFKTIVELLSKIPYAQISI